MNAVAERESMNGYRYDIGAIQFDVVIVGAGINGSAIARDAAMRGLQVLLVDKGDVSAGTFTQAPCGGTLVSVRLAP